MSVLLADQSQIVPIDTSHPYNPESRDVEFWGGRLLTGIDGSVRFYLPATQTVQDTATHCLTFFGAGVGVNFLLRRNFYNRLVERGWITPLDLPEAVYQFANGVNNTLFIPFHRHASDIEQGVVIQAPILEETAFRLVLQELLLKQLPQCLLSRALSRERASQIVDSKIMKIVRILISTIPFILIHASPTTRPLFLVNALIVGVGCGMIQETTGNPLYAIAFHTGANVVGGYAMQLLHELAADS